ncbi:MAG: MCE family protein [Actinobacteria bacterium]|nr:MCE family protein [Actinomycetota bacterium]
MRRLYVVVAGLLGLALITAGIYYSVRAAYGAYGDYYYLTTDLDRAGQGMQVESDVRMRGVEIGKVVDIRLVDRRARIRLQIEDHYKVPEDVRAVVSLKTPLGAKYVDLQFEGSLDGPFLADGDTIADSHVGPELEDLLDDGTHLMDAVDADELANVIGTLADASRGRGEVIARGLQLNNELSSLFANTLEPQTRAIEDFETIFGALESKGVDLNMLAAAMNEGAPVYASEEAQANLRRALEAVVPFADDLADLLILQLDDWDRMMDEGDVVLSTIAARPEGLRNLVHGLYRYVYKLGQPIGDFFMISDGSAGAGFVNFMGGNDQEEEENQICTAFPVEVRDQIPACAEATR